MARVHRSRYQSKRERDCPEGGEVGGLSLEVEMREEEEGRKGKTEGGVTDQVIIMGTAEIKSQSIRIIIE